MNWPYIHLLTNHFPVILAMLGGAMALLALVSGRRSIWLYALTTLVLAGASVGPTYLVGREAEEMVRTQPVIDRKVLHDHEEASEKATIILLATGALAAYGWWRAVRAGPSRDVDLMPIGPSHGRRLLRPDPVSVVALPLWLRSLITASAIASMGAVGYAAYMGGHIFHGDNSLTSPPAMGAPTR